jgi:hypothetical protein
MKHFSGLWLLGLACIASSILLYGIQILIFKRTGDTVFYFLQDLSFIPIYVLLVVIIVDNLLKIREQQAMMKKMNMIIGVFFSECGKDMLCLLIKFNSNSREFCNDLLFDNSWNDAKFEKARERLKSIGMDIDLGKSDMVELKNLLRSKTDFILRLLENPMLLEHDSFTDLLWAISHLEQELNCRKDLHSLSAADSSHISGDIKRAYVNLLGEWLSYLAHLRKEYPYLYSLEIRTNPFDPKADSEVK